MNISEALKALTGAKLINAGRTGSTVWLQFHSSVGVKYALHFQCPCRFENDKEILVANGDMYIPATKHSGDHIDIDLGIYGENLFDEIIVTLSDKYFVLECTIGLHNEMHVLFTGDISFTSYSYISTNEEQWRFFEMAGCKTKEEWDEYFVHNPDGKCLIVTPLDFIT